MEKSIEKVSIIGLGALGVLYGEHLSKVIPFEDLRIIVDEKRKHKYEEEGVYCNGNKCNLNFVLAEDIVEPADLLIFAVKYIHLEEAIKSVKHHVGENTIILSVLNGIVSEIDIAKVYGAEHNLYCVAQGMTATKVDNQVTYRQKGIICFGELNQDTNSPKVNRLKDFFDRVEMPYEINNQMSLKLWSKLMVNVGINQTVGYYNATNLIVQKPGPERELMLAAMKEVLKLANCEGINLGEDEIDYWLNIIDELEPEGKPSMAQDVSARRYTEIDLFGGTIVNLGKKHGIETPVNQMFYEHYTKLEKTY